MLVLAQTKARPLVQPLPEPTGDAEIKAPGGSENAVRFSQPTFPASSSDRPEDFLSCQGRPWLRHPPMDLVHMLVLRLLLELVQHPPGHGASTPPGQPCPTTLGTLEGVKEGPHPALLSPKCKTQQFVQSVAGSCSDLCPLQGLLCAGRGGAQTSSSESV